MITQQQTIERLLPLLKQHPQAFKRSFLFYGFIQVEGALDTWKELIPWLIAFTIFLPTTYLIHYFIQLNFIQISSFQSYSISAILITLFLMVILPFIIYQIRHSSHQLYTSLKNAPFKVTLLIILQAINLKFFESSLLLSLLFFLSISYGFIGFYKENLFKPYTAQPDQYNLKLIRNACFWSHLKIIQLSIRIKLSKKSSQNYQQILAQKSSLIQLNTELNSLESELYKSLKYADLETYIDELMK